MNNLKIFTAVIVAIALFTVNAHEGCSHGVHEHKHKEHKREEHHHEHKHDEKHEHKHDTHKHDEHKHEHKHGESCGGAHYESIEVGELALKSIGLSTVHPEMRKLRSTMPVIGRMELASDARKDAPAPVAGRLSLKVRELDDVKKGDVLFTVDSPNIKALSHEIKVLKARLEVYRKLKTTNAEIEATLKVKISEKESLVAGAEEKDGVVTVRAAADAMVEKLNVADGAWGETGTAAVSLVRTKALRFRGIVVASEAAKLHDGMKMIVSGVEAKLRLGLGDDTGMTPVYAIFADGTAPGRAGERVRAECVLDENGKATLAVPDECIINVGAEPTVFVKDGEKHGRFFAIKVQTGISNSGWTEVKGLPHRDHLDVVKDGVYGLKLQLASKSGEKPIGHFHSDGTFHEGDH